MEDPLFGSGPRGTAPRTDRRPVGRHNRSAGVRVVAVMGGDGARRYPAHRLWPGVGPVEREVEGDDDGGRRPFRQRCRAVGARVVTGEGGDGVSGVVSGPCVPSGGFRSGGF